MKKIYLELFFFVSDVISEVGFWPFRLMLPGLGPNRQTEVFRWSFHWKIDKNRVLVSELCPWKSHVQTA